MLTGHTDDPLQLAGPEHCHHCQRAAFPIDATWLDDRLILASYPRVCAHVPASTRLTCTECERQRPPVANLGLLLPGRRCGALNHRRRPCRAWALPGSLFCRSHPDGGAQDGAG